LRILCELGFHGILLVASFEKAVLLCNPLGSGSQQQYVFLKPMVNSRQWELVYSSSVAVEEEFVW